jgi:hypothetical protein
MAKKKYAVMSQTDSRGNARITSVEGEGLLSKKKAKASFKKLKKSVPISTTYLLVKVVKTWPKGKQKEAAA